MDEPAERDQKQIREDRRRLLGVRWMNVAQLSIEELEERLGDRAARRAMTTTQLGVIAGIATDKIRASDNWDRTKSESTPWLEALVSRLARMQQGGMRLTLETTAVAAPEPVRVLDIGREPGQE